MKIVLLQVREIKRVKGEKKRLKEIIKTEVYFL